MNIRLLIVLAVTVAVGGFTLPGFLTQATAAEQATASKPASGQKPTDDYYELYKMLADAMDQVERNYVEEISRRELMEAAIEGVIKKLDPYSSYIKPKELESFRTSVESEFGGIGIQITLDRGQLKVLSPLVGTPAYRAGIRAGDAIVNIEGKSTEGITLSGAVKQLKGKAGSPVNISIRHPDSSKLEEVRLTREVIQIKTVLGDHRKANDSWDFFYDQDKRIGYIRVSAFSRDTAKDLRKALSELKENQVKGLVLDLRFNPGGLLTSAIEISDLFVSDGKIVSTKGRNARERVWNAHKAGTFAEFPLAVLVNRYSASASEIVSGCLQDHKRAIIVGERTWGKGSVQNVIELENGKSALKLTTASYHRPSGKNIHRFPDAKDSDVWGVNPNDGYAVRFTNVEMAQFVKNRRDRDLVVSQRPGKTAPLPKVGAPPEPQQAEDDLPTAFEDRQLQKALDYLSQELARAS